MIDFKKSYMIWDSLNEEWLEFYFTDAIKLIIETFLLEKNFDRITKKIDKQIKQLVEINQQIQSSNDEEVVEKLGEKFEKINNKCKKNIKLQQKYNYNHELVMSMYKEFERRM